MFWSLSLCSDILCVYCSYKIKLMYVLHSVFSLVTLLFQGSVSLVLFVCRGNSNCKIVSVSSNVFCRPMSFLFCPVDFHVHIVLSDVWAYPVFCGWIAFSYHFYWVMGLFRKFDLILFNFYVWFWTRSLFLLYPYPFFYS